MGSSSSLTSGSGGKKVTLVLVCLCLAGVLGLLLLCLRSKSLREPPHFKYGIVLDAGSSHTAMFVYKWPADKENDTGVVSEHSMCDVKGGGISNYTEDPSLAGKSLERCLDQALGDVPKEKHAATPLYLGATAGMRLLNLTDPKTSEQVLKAVTSTLERYPFDFRGARILSGDDEGVFGWVTANYLLENFIKYDWVGQLIRPKKRTLGALDLGGASTQITFETSEDIESRPANEATLRLYGQTYKLYTHSFLCYGRDQILKRVLSKVLKAERHALNVENPCWPRGYTQRFALGMVYDSPCTVAEKPTNYFPGVLTNMSGSGDPARCRQHVESLFQFTNCSYTRCSFDNVSQPNVTGNFIAFSAFFYTVDFLQSVLKRRISVPSDLRSAAQELCNTSMPKLREKAPLSLEKWLPDYCPMSTFIDLLLLRGYQFDETTFPNIAFQKKAGDTSVGWALGYMLNLTNMIPADESATLKGTVYGHWLGLILLSVAIILITLAAIFWLLRSSKQQGVI